MSAIYRKIKEISFIVAGALLGIIFIPYESEISSKLMRIISLIIFLLLVGSGFFEWIYAIWILFWRKINQIRKIAGIFAPYEIDNQTSSYITVSLRQLKEEFKKEKIKFEIIKEETKLNQYSIVVNPYGGVYPEKNLTELSSLNLIFDYVRKGGIYINIADIPFYYAFDNNLNRRVDTTPLAGDFSQVRSFLQTILTKKLHCFVYGLTSGDDFEQGITRIVSLSNNSKNLFNKEIVIQADKCSPRLAIPFGKGYFVFSTLQTTNNNLKSISDLIFEAEKLL